MALFISHENQTLIWNVISKNKLVNDYFFYHPPNKKTEWFKSIVQIFYDKNRGRLLNQTELLLLNKTVISYMVQNIKDNISESLPKKQVNIDADFLKSHSITENKVEKIGNRFSKKQLEYNSLFDKKVPETIDFAEKQDAPLSNMDELIKQHLKEREEELRKYAPLPLVTLPANATVQTEAIQNKLKIDKSSDNINIQIEEINEEIKDDNNEEKDNERKKKSVSWSDDPTSVTLTNHQTEIELLKSQINDLSKKVKALLDKYE
jgi:hypothetical protein